MTIEKDLPFAYCENCEKFVVDVDEQVIFTTTFSRTVLNIRCKNAWLCKQLKQNMEGNKDAFRKDATLPSV